jgi:membrane fusion protein (multidrug efflux system)
MTRERKIYFIFAVIILAACFVAAACSDSTKAAPSTPPPKVSVLEVAAEDVPIFSDYAAQTFARDMVEVRGRVDGYIEKRLFQVGSTVKAGQPLYILDLRPYQAEVSKARADVAESEASVAFAEKQVALLQAEADLAEAEANLLKAKQDVERLQPLVEQDAAPKQDLDNALAALQANQANVNARKANVEQTRLSTGTQVDSSRAQLDANRALLRTADLNLEYATIRAPIDGRIGDSLVQVGGLVTRNAEHPLTTIVPLDPIWVRFQVSEAEALAYLRMTSAKAEAAPLQLILADGTEHPHLGRFENTVNQVDPRTGTLEVQATFPNPEHTLLPGQFGRVRVRSAEKKDALLVPQKAVQELQGLQSVLAVGPDNKVLARSVVTGDRIDERWIIEQGLKPGDRVIVEGLQKARPGTEVDPQPYQPPSSEDKPDESASSEEGASSGE